MVKDRLLVQLLTPLSNRLKLIEKRHGYLSFLIQKRFANERLLQLETMHIISKMPEVVDYLPEKTYTLDGKEKCDFWFRTKDEEYWLEIKMRPTNYRKPGHAKAITNGVKSIIQDIERLQGIKNRQTRKFVMFAFYPMYKESYRTFNKFHLPSIVKAAEVKIDGPTISLKVGDASFDVYFIELS